MSNDQYKSVSVINDMYKGNVKDNSHIVEYAKNDHSQVLNGTNKSLLIEKENEFFLNDLNLLPFFNIKATSKDPLVCSIVKEGECEKA